MTSALHGVPPLVPRENACLRALSPAALALLRPHLSKVFHRDATQLWEASDTHGPVYFPLTGYVSLVVNGRDGDAIEVGNVGQEAAAAVCFSPHSSCTRMTGVVTCGGDFL